MSASRLHWKRNGDIAWNGWLGKPGESRYVYVVALDQDKRHILRVDLFDRSTSSSIWQPKELPEDLTDARAECQAHADAGYQKLLRGRGELDWRPAETMPEDYSAFAPTNTPHWWGG